MENETKISLAMATCGLITVIAGIIFILVTGCGGGDDGDDNDCMAMGNCPDAGPMTADADPMGSDADTTPDANSDPCAGYAQYNGQMWTCGGSFTPTTCTLQVFEDHGACYIFCLEACPVPPSEDLAAGNFTCTTVTNAQQQCWQ